MDVVRLDSTPEPLTEDPFAGANTITVLEFDPERFRAAGATDEELATLSGHYDTMNRGERQRLAGWLERSSDDDVSGWLAQWREFVAQAQAEAALIDGTVEEVLARVQEAPDDERLELAERTLAAEEAQDDDARSTLIEGLEGIIALLDEAQRVTAEQEALVEGTVEEVLARVGDDAELAARTLQAELARGEDARTTLVEPLQALAGEGAVEPAAGSGGPDTPERTGTPASGSDGGAAGAPDAAP